MPLPNFNKSEKKVLIYCILALVFVMITCGTVVLHGKSPPRTYGEVGNISDVTSIHAYHLYNETKENLGKNETITKLLECDFSEFRFHNRLLLRVDNSFEVYIVHIFINQSVLRNYPNILALKISVNGSKDFAYALNVWKLNVSTTESDSDKPNFHNKSLADYYSYIDIEKHYYRTGKWTFYSKSKPITLANLQIHHWFNQSGLSHQGEYNDSRPNKIPGDFIELLVTNDYGHGIKLNRIKRVEIADLTFIKEKEGRVPPQPLSPYFLPLTFYFLLILILLPILFLKFKGKSQILTILVVGFLLRTAIAPLTSHTFDIIGCKRAVRTYYEQGEFTLFNTWTSPPPWFFTLIAFHSPYVFLRLLGVPDFRIGYQPILAIEVFFIKLPLMLSDVVSAYLIYKMCKKRDLDEKASRLAAAVYMFNPFSIFISSIWGMFDSLAVLLMLLGFYFFLENNLFLTSLIWGFGVKWYTLSFIPVLSILSFYKEKKKAVKYKLLTSILMIIIGFGIFTFTMVTPHILNGDLSYLKQVLDFRLKIGAGGEDRTSVATFFGPVFWRVFQAADLAGPFPSLFVYTFGLLYSVLIFYLVVYLRKYNFKKASGFKILCNVTVATLLLFYATYPQLTPQCVLWIIPLLIFEYFIFHQISPLSLGIVSSLLLPYLQPTYFIMGFPSHSSISLQAVSNPLEWVFGALLLSIAVSFLVKGLPIKFQTRIRKVGKRFFGDLSRAKLVLIFLSTTTLSFLLVLPIFMGWAEFLVLLVVPIVLTFIVQVLVMVKIEP